MHIESPINKIVDGIGLKASSQTITQLEIYSADLDLIRKSLLQKSQQAPQFFKNLPVIVNLNTCHQKQFEFNETYLLQLIQILKDAHLKPFAFKTDRPSQQLIIEKFDFILWNKNTTSHSTPLRTQPNVRITPPAAKKIYSESNTPAPKIITQPVRSGQQVIAEHGDLIVLAPVSPGAEIIAKGHIHVYAPLRGRAMAGVPHNTQARIFCTCLEAELVAIAGQYYLTEQIDRDWNRQACQIYLEQDSLQFAKLCYK